MNDTIDWQALANQYMTENEQYRRENETWRAQWKGFQEAQRSHWTLTIRKPDFLEALREWAHKIKGMEPQRLYLYTLILCTVLGTLIECVALFVKRGEVSE